MGRPRVAAARRKPAVKSGRVTDDRAVRGGVPRDRLAATVVVRCCDDRLEPPTPSRHSGWQAGRSGQRGGSLDRRGFPWPRGLSDQPDVRRRSTFCGSAALRGWGGSGAAAPPVRSGRATAVAGLSVATSIGPSPRAAAHGRLVTPCTVCGNKRGPLVGRGAAQDHAQRDQVTDDAREIGKHVTRSSEEADQEPYRHRGDEEQDVLGHGFSPVGGGECGKNPRWAHQQR